MLTIKNKTMLLETISKEDLKPSKIMAIKIGRMFDTFVKGGELTTITKETKKGETYHIYSIRKGRYVMDINDNRSFQTNISILGDDEVKKVLLEMHGKTIWTRGVYLNAMHSLSDDVFKMVDNMAHRSYHQNYDMKHGISLQDKQEEEFLKAYKVLDLTKSNGMLDPNIYVLDSSKKNPKVASAEDIKNAQPIEVEEEEGEEE